LPFIDIHANGFTFLFLGHLGSSRRYHNLRRNISSSWLRCS